MKYIIQVSLLLCATFFLVGCAHRMETFKDMPSFNEGSKGVIIMRNYEVSKRARYCNVQSEWWHAESQKFLITDNCALPGFLDLGCSDPGNKFSVYFVTPGVYSLSAIEIDGCWTNKQHARDMKDFASFHVNAGEVVYVGDVVFTEGKSNKVALALKIDDNYEDAKQYFKMRYQEITRVPTKRLIQFSDRINLARRLLVEYGSLN